MRDLQPKVSAVFADGHPDQALSSFQAAQHDAVKAYVPPWVPDPRQAILYDDIKCQPAIPIRFNIHLWGQHGAGHLSGEHPVGLVLIGLENFDGQAPQVGWRGPSAGGSLLGIGMPFPGNRLAGGILDHLLRHEIPTACVLIGFSRRLHHPHRLRVAF
jgi:hypothetical protein